MANLLLQLDQASEDSLYTTDTLTNVGLFSTRKVILANKH